jgi:hypothetical protein
VQDLVEHVRVEEQLEDRLQQLADQARSQAAGGASAASCDSFPSTTIGLTM